jgi:hypothetical protein
VLAVPDAVRGKALAAGASRWLDDLQPVGRHMLAAADRIAAASSRL